MRGRFLSLVSGTALFICLMGLCGAPQAEQLPCDVCVVGGGSGGFGAALAAARAGADTVLIEKQPILGGTSTSAFVSNWEPGPGCAFARELYTLLAREEGAVAIAPRTHAYTPDEPYGLCLGDPRFSYEDSLQRAGVPSEKQCSVVMRPESLAAAMATLLRDAGVRVYLNTAFKEVEIADDVVRRVTCVDGTGAVRDIHAKVFIDATGGAALCQAAGCAMMLGEEGRERFNEPSAPVEPRHFLNGISLCYRITRGGTETATPTLPAPADGFSKVAFIHGVDARELTVNTLALLPGMDLVDKGYDAMLGLARERVAGHWSWLCAYPAFQEYTFKDSAPMPGIRESYRVVTEYILTEQDVRAGLAGQAHPDVIAIADHALDIHGSSHGTKEVNGCYGIPYRCLVPKGTRNLLVACRGAGFSHIAASSCRLSRTIMALGHAAGIAAAEAAGKDGDVRAIDVARVPKYWQ